MQYEFWISGTLTKEIPAASSFVLIECEAYGYWHKQNIEPGNLYQGFIEVIANGGLCLNLEMMWFIYCGLRVNLRKSLDSVECMSRIMDIWRVLRVEKG